MRSRRGHVGFWLGLAVVVIYPAISVFFKVRWRGREHMPKSGGAIVVVNHISYVDPLTFARFVWDSGRIPRFLAKDSLFKIFFVGRVLRGAGQIPVSRGTVDAQSSLAHAVAALGRGEVVCIYPEGTVTKDPDYWPMVGRTGVARLALSTGVPVIPVAQWGAQEAVDVVAERENMDPRHQVNWVAGPTVDLSPLEGRAMTADVLREVTDVIMVRVRDMLGELRGEQAPKDFWRKPMPARKDVGRKEVGRP